MEIIQYHYYAWYKQRKEIITSSILLPGKSLEDSIHDLFTGDKGLEHGVQGASLLIYVYKEAGKDLFTSIFAKYPEFIQSCYKICSEAFAARINSLNKGYL